MDLSLDEVKLLKNEIYARNGYVFEKWIYNEHFSSKNWYAPINDNNAVVLNAVEKENVSLLTNRERELKQKRSALIAQLDVLCERIKSDDSLLFVKEYNYTEGFHYSVKYIKEALAVARPKEIHFYKNSGLYQVSIDNGFGVLVLSLKIEGDIVRIGYNQQGHSKVIENFDVFTEYRSEMNEFSYAWELKFEDDKLTFLQSVAAG